MPEFYKTVIFDEISLELSETIIYNLALNYDPRQCVYLSIDHRECVLLSIDQS